MTTGDEILAALKAHKEQIPYETPDCPICGWSIEKHPDGTLHCQLCGWTYPQRLGEGKELDG